MNVFIALDIHLQAKKKKIPAPCLNMVSTSVKLTANTELKCMDPGK
jgi:hypothetical protein